MRYLGTCPYGVASRSGTGHPGIGRRASDAHMAHAQAQFQEFSTNPLSTPQPIVLCHLSDQGDRFLGDLGLARSGLGLALPIHAKELPMEAGAGCLVARLRGPAARYE